MQNVLSKYKTKELYSAGVKSFMLNVINVTKYTIMNCKGTTLIFK